jgi:hypothetical protein
MKRLILTLPPFGAARTAAVVLARAFGERLGDGLKVFDCQAHGKGFTGLLKPDQAEFVPDFVNQGFIVQTFDFEADVALIFALSPINLFSLDLLRRHRIKTVLWFYEDYREAPYWRDVLPGLDLMLGIQRGPFEAACQRAGTHFAFLPAAASLDLPERVRPYNERPADAVFVGLPSPYRIRCLETLAGAGLKLAIGGQGWDRVEGVLRPFIRQGNWIEGSQASALYSEGKLGLNLSMREPGVERTDVHVSPRLFDIAGQGCWPITENVPLLPETATDLDCATFTDRRELAHKSLEMLSKGPPPGLLERNWVAAHHRHSPAARVEEFLNLIG